MFILVILFCILTVVVYILLFFIICFPCILMSTEKYIDMNICVKSTKLSSLNLMVHSDLDSLKIGNGTYKIVWKCLNWNYQKFNFKIILKHFSKTHSKAGGILGTYQCKSPRLFSKSKRNPFLLYSTLKNYF